LGGPRHSQSTPGRFGGVPPLLPDADSSGNPQLRPRKNAGKSARGNNGGTPPTFSSTRIRPRPLVSADGTARPAVGNRPAGRMRCENRPRSPLSSPFPISAPAAALVPPRETRKIARLQDCKTPPSAGGIRPCLPLPDDAPRPEAYYTARCRAPVRNGIGSARRTGRGEAHSSSGSLLRNHRNQRR
jgi:hypothetical protein